MKVIVCVDDNYGMMFGERRLSRDRKVTEAIQRLCEGKRLWMNGYSSKIYGNMLGVEIHVEETFLNSAGAEDYCLVESGTLKPYEKFIDQLIIFYWNRKYPSDVRLDLEIQGYAKVSEEEFPGTSHEKITKTVYVKSEE